MDIGSFNIDNCYNTGKIEGTDWIGGIAGFFNGEKIYQCYNIGEIKGTRDCVGGIIGGNFLTNGTKIEKCYNLGDISGSNNIGGIGGGFGHVDNIGYAINCYNLGKIYGNKISGIVYGNHDKIKVVSCYNIGELNGTTKYGISYKGVIENCYYLTNHGVSTENASEVTSEQLKGLATTLDKTYTIDDENNTITINENTSQNVWKNDTNNKNEGYPIFNWQ